MTKTQIKEAQDFTAAKIKSLTDAIIAHYQNPYVSVMAQDVRYWEDKLSELNKLDKETYPTIEEIENASLKQVMIWYRDIPPPRTPGETEVRSKMFDLIRTK